MSPRPNYDVMLANRCYRWQNDGMPVQITVRDIPERVRDELAARAAREGKSMQEYLKAELERRAYEYGKEMAWPNVGRRVLALTRDVLEKAVSAPEEPVETESPVHST